jgi:hypothetical protein
MSGVTNGKTGISPRFCNKSDIGVLFYANFASLCPHILIFNGFDIRFAGNNRNVADMTHAVKQIELLFHLSRMHFSNSCMR